MPTFWTVPKKLFRKSGQKKKKKEKGFFSTLLRNSLESWQISEYPLCKIIASQKNLGGYIWQFLKGFDQFSETDLNQIL